MLRLEAVGLSLIIEFQAGAASGLARLVGGQFDGLGLPFLGLVHVAALRISRRQHVQAIPVLSRA